MIHTHRNLFEDKCLKLIKSEIAEPTVMQLGSRAIYGASDSVKKLFPSCDSFVGVDYINGVGVDIVADAHRLSDKFLPSSIDVIWSDATLEHLKNVHIAAGEMATVLRVGGYCVHITHQTFPIHAYPQDYWRFSTEAMSAIFCKEFGFEIVDTAYCWPVAITSVSGYDDSPMTQPCFIHTMVIARKICEPVKELALLRDVLFPK